ncbi:MAG TPA: class I SAM-dependent methyltransferase [Micromonosporaceae bacterium]|nr:class I SAM-dependent methyltransferase [Micromonosporaceae bacterium]
MADSVAERVERYILDGDDQDLQRLVKISRATAEMTRAAFRRVGVQQGWHAIDCGCGPIGGLAVMAEVVGPTGRIVGVDFNTSAVAQARTVASALGLSNVEVFAADIHDLDPASLGGPFDLAYTRLFLMHQANPVHTLRQIAALLRPGGWLVAQEAVRLPPPRSQPDLDALGDYWAVLHEMLERAGMSANAVADLPQSAREAGFEVATMSGHFMVHDPASGFELHAGTMAAARDRAVRSGVATEQRADDLVTRLREATSGDYTWVSSPFFLDLALRKPITA